MTFAAVGSPILASSSSFSLTPHGVGDLILIEITNTTTNIITVTGVASSNVTWKKIAGNLSGVTNPMTSVIYAGTVTSTSLATVTISWSGTTPTTRVSGQEFSSTVGSWSVVAQGNLDGSGTATWPSLTALAGNLYFGYATDGGAVAGSTPGFTYVVDSHTSGMAYNANCSAGAVAPVWGDSGMAFGNMVLVREGPPTGLGTVPWTLLQSEGNALTSAQTSVAQQFTTPLSRGSKLLVFVGGRAEHGYTTVTDTNGNTYTLLTDTVIDPAGTGTQNLDVWYLDTPNAAVGTTPTVTANWTPGGAHYGDIVIQEVAGLMPGSIAEDIPAGTLSGTSSGTVGPPSYASIASGEYLVYVATDDAGGFTWTPPSGYTVANGSSNSNANANLVVAYKNSTGGTETGQWSVSGTTDWALCLVAFKLNTNVNVNGNTAAVVVRPHMGQVLINATTVSASVKSAFYARIAVSAQATMEFEAGQPVQISLTTLASDPWISMYPG